MPPTIDVIAKNSPEVRIEFQSVINRAYSIEYNDGLLDTNGWFVATDFTNVAGTGSTMIYIDDGTGTGTAPTNSVSRFYRLKEAIP